MLTFGTLIIRRFFKDLETIGTSKNLDVSDMISANLILIILQGPVRFS